MSGEKVALFRERASAAEKCGRCTHPLGDHEGMPCMLTIVVEGQTKPCPCSYGVRTDVFLCQQMSKVQEQQAQIIQGLMSIDRTLEKIRLMTGERLGLEVVDLPDGGYAIKRKLVGV